MKKNLFENLNEKKRILKLISAAFVSAAVAYGAPICISSAMRRADRSSVSQEKVGLEYKRQNKISDFSGDETRSVAMHATSNAKFFGNEVSPIVDRDLLEEELATFEDEDQGQAEVAEENVGDDKHFHRQAAVDAEQQEKKTEIVSPELLKQAVVLDKAKEILQIFDCRTEGISVHVENITSEQMDALLFLLRAGVISSLDLRRCVMPDHIWGRFVDELKHNTTLTRLALNECALNEKRIRLIADLITNNTTITDLGLCCGLDNFSVGLLLPALLQNSVIQQLDLSHNQMSYFGARLISGKLKNNTVLTRFDLSYNHIGDRGVQCVTSELVHNKTLQELNLAGNYIGDQIGAKAIIDMLRFNTTLKKLDLSGSKIQTYGIRRITAELSHNTTLEQLRLCDITLTSIGVDAIAYMLVHNIALTHVDLSGDGISYYGVFRISEALKKNKRLAHIDLSNNKLDALCASMVADMLKQNDILTECDLSANAIGNVGFHHIARALGENKTLRWLDLRFNGISDYDPIAVALRRNTSLTTLHLHDSDRT